MGNYYPVAMFSSGALSSNFSHIFVLKDSNPLLKQLNKISFNKIHCNNKKDYLAKVIHRITQDNDYNSELDRNLWRISPDRYKSIMLPKLLIQSLCLEFGLIKA